MTTVNELLVKHTENPRPIGIKVSSKEVAESKDAHGRLLRNKYTFPFEDLLVTVMYSYGQDQIQITFYAEDGAYRNATLPGNFELTYLEGEALEKLTSSLEKKQYAELHTQLGHGGSVAAYVQCFVKNAKNECVPSSLYLGPKVSTGAEPAYYAQQQPNQKGFGTEYQSTYNGCLAGAIDSIAHGFKSTYLAAKKKFPEAEVTFAATMPISSELMKSSDDAATALSSPPVLNAYGLKVNAPKVKDIPYRVAQSSLQFQFHALGKTEAVLNPIVKVVDATLGVACVSLLAGFSSPDKIKLGGLPGDYRILATGMEYAALDNAWLCHPMITNLVFDFGRKCVVLGQKGLGKLWKASEEEVLACMMSNDVELAHTIMDRNKELMLKMFQAAWPVCNGGNAAGVPKLEIEPALAQETIYNVFYKGLGSIIETPYDMKSNWTLDGTWIGHSEGDGKNVWRTINAMLGTKKFPNHVVF